MANPLPCHPLISSSYCQVIQRICRSNLIHFDFRNPQLTQPHPSVRLYILFTCNRLCRFRGARFCPFSLRTILSTAEPHDLSLFRRLVGSDVGGFLAFNGLRSLCYEDIDVASCVVDVAGRTGLFADYDGVRAGLKKVIAR